MKELIYMFALIMLGMVFGIAITRNSIHNTKIDDKSSITRIGNGLSKFENDEVICYKSDYGLSCKWKE